MTRRLLAALAALLMLPLFAPQAAGSRTMPPTVVQDAMYSWWTGPLAVGDGGWTWLNSVTRRGVNVIRRLDNATGQASSVALDGPHTADEHNAAALAVDPNQADLLAFSSRHNQDSHVRMQTINRDALAVGAQVQLGMGGTVSYAQVLVHGATIHLLCRRNQSQWVYRTSPDWGATWGPTKLLADGTGLGQVYVATRADPADPLTVHMTVSGHPNPNQSSLAKVGYARIRLDTGAVTKVGGGSLGDLDTAGGPGILPEAMSQAIEPSSAYRVRVLDVATIDGQPAVAYAVWKHGDAGYPPRYKIKRWTGSAWETSPWELNAGSIFGHIASAHYHGGVAISDSGGLWTSRETGGEWVVESWIPSGASWTLTAEVARAETRLIRPYAIRSATGPELVYQDCLYEAYTRYYGDTVIG